jgi:anti-repressor protein
LKIADAAGRLGKDYYLTLGMAKELCMVENNAKGQEARLYFIEMERSEKSVQGGGMGADAPQVRWRSVCEAENL